MVQIPTTAEDANENVLDDLVDHISIDLPDSQLRYTWYLENFAKAAQVKHYFCIEVGGYDLLSLHVPSSQSDWLMQKTFFSHHHNQINGSNDK